MSPYPTSRRSTLKDAIWSAKQKEAEPKRKEQERIALEKRDKEEFDRMGWHDQEKGYLSGGAIKTAVTLVLLGTALTHLMQVWCRDREYGDIYAQANFLQN